MKIWKDFHDECHVCIRVTLAANDCDNVRVVEKLLQNKTGVCKSLRRYGGVLERLENNLI